jgi:hypothetical protein
MKHKTLLIAALLATALLGAATSAAFGESFRLGVSVGPELVNRPTCESILLAFDRRTDLLPGFYWEVLMNHVGLGMTYLADFHDSASPYPELDKLWYLDWVGSLDLRYHFLPDFVLDPFLEAGVGNAGRVDISAYQENGLPSPERLLGLSLFGQAGAGLAVRLSALHVGARLLWRFANEPVPATSFEPYPLKNFRFDLFGGFSL